MTKKKMVHNSKTNKIYNKEYHCLNVNITGDDLHYIIVDFLKDKLGDIEINSLELTDDDNMFSGLLNSDVSKFNIFVKYLRN